jgi:peptidoglycan-associated lipoprotein
MNFTGKLIALATATLLGACVENTTGGNGGFYGAGGAGGGASMPASPEFFNQTIGKRILFEVDQSSLTPDAQAILQGQANWLMANGGYSAVIEGHADEQGTREYNLALGARRANSVREFLVDRGVAGSRLRVVSYGKERPLEICSSEACYTQNRRADTVISAALSS